MNKFFGFVNYLNRGLNAIAGLSLVFIVTLTTCDVILRAFKLPIIGTYEIVSYTVSIVILFALPLTSWLHAHIYVDFLIQKLPSFMEKIIIIFTRLLVLFLFYLFAWNMIKYGMDLQRLGEVSTTLKISYFPVVYAAGACCFVQCLVVICDIIKIIGGKYGE